MRLTAPLSTLIHTLGSLGNTGAVANAARACAARDEALRATDAALRSLAARSSDAGERLPRSA